MFGFIPAMFDPDKDSVMSSLRKKKNGQKVIIIFSKKK